MSILCVIIEIIPIILIAIILYILIDHLYKVSHENISKKESILEKIIKFGKFNDVVKKDPEKISNYILLFIYLISLVEVFLIIHFLFCYNIGLPASVRQDNSNDLTLTSSDWLQFLSGYLSFAGALVMAYLVYHQSKRIDELTLSEYRTSITIKINETIRIDDIDGKGESKNYPLYVDGGIIQCRPGNSDDQYYTLHFDVTEDSEGLEKGVLLIFAEICNNSRSNINNISFTQIDVCEIENDSATTPAEGFHTWTYQNRKNKDHNWDPADKVCKILAKEKLKRCFLLNKVPESCKPSWLTIKLGSTDDNNNNSNIDIRVLVAKNSKEPFTYIQ